MSVSITAEIATQNAYKYEAIYREYPRVPRNRVSRGPSTLLIVLRSISHISKYCMEERRGPGKECKECKGSISSCRSVGLSRCVDLTASANPSQGIEHARAHETDESKHRHLEVRVVVDSLESCGAFEDLLALGAGVFAPTFERLLWEDVCHENGGSVGTGVLSPTTQVLIGPCDYQTSREMSM